MQSSQRRTEWGEVAPTNRVAFELDQKREEGPKKSRHSRNALCGVLPPQNPVAEEFGAAVIGWRCLFTAPLEIVKEIVVEVHHRGAGLQQNADARVN